MASSNDTPVRAGIGLACLLGAAILAWLSSPATLSLERRDDGPATAVFEARLFGVLAHAVGRVEGIETVTVVTFRGPGSDSDTPDRIVFSTAGGPVDLGRNQQLFAPDVAQIRGFLDGEDPGPLTLSSIARRREAIRFVVAQVIALLLFVGGLGLVQSAVRRRSARD